MVRVNLLASAVQETAATPAPKPAQATGQILTVAVAFLTLIIAIGADYQVTYSRLADAEARLKTEKEAKVKLEAIKKQAEEFKKKNEIVQNRLKIIKQLAASQRGPVAVLSNINDRIPTGVQLENIKQRGNQITIDGKTERKELVTQFAQQLERFSNGLFTNVDPTFDSTGVGGVANPDDKEAQVLRFTIVCNYNPPQPAPGPGEAGKTASVPPGK
ncbi:MAG: PilN domain-containing protein [Blastocatellia bacterium]|nr:PilN domain-containing protein [Blastocatellia bacterium]